MRGGFRGQRGGAEELRGGRAGSADQARDHAKAGLLHAGAAPAVMRHVGSSTPSVLYCFSILFGVGWGLWAVWAEALFDACCGVGAEMDAPYRFFCFHLIAVSVLFWSAAELYECTVLERDTLLTPLWPTETRSCVLTHVRRNPDRA
jgi:hypothetical protein